MTPAQVSRRPKTWQGYGFEWPLKTSRIEAITYCVRAGGEFTASDGRRGGASLFSLYREFQSIVWPEDDHHEWSDLILQTTLQERVTVVQGSKDCSKTRTIAKYGLTDFFFFPRETLILFSSTDLRGLELRVWGDLKTLFARALEIWPEAPGHPVDSLHGIFADELGDDAAIRDLRRGLICIPCLESGGSWKGLEKYTGIKQKRRRLLGDEVQFMQAPYLTTLANLNKGDFKGVFVGNPIGEGDPLDKLAEPVEGWDGAPDVTETTTWKNRMGGVTVQLVGSDSPAIHHPGKYVYLINQSDLDYISGYWGKDSSEWWNQGMGIRRPGVSARRVVTRDMARQFGAQEDVVWRGGPITKIYALDASYGGDRCVGGLVEFGLDVGGKVVIACHTPVLVPVRQYPRSVPESERVIAEDQIATFVKADCERQGVPPENVFFDATGRGSLGTSFARIWSALVNPVEFGGVPTPRPVCDDLYIYDDKLKQKRLKRADEHYSKKVTELWFSVRYVIEGRQMRQLPNDVLDELCAREWMQVRGNKIELESKEDMKPRFGRSPDLADWCFSGETKVLTPRGWQRIDSLLPSEFVTTPFGSRHIRRVSVNFVEELTGVEFSNGAVLKGRGEHPIFTWDRGWVPLTDLSFTTRVESVTNLPLWQLLSVLFTKAEPTGFSQLADTIRTKTGTVSRSDFFTAVCGETILDLYQRAIAFITKTATGAIIESPIWSWLLSKNMQPSICGNVGKTQNRRACFGLLYEEPLSARPDGTPLLREGCGTARILNGSGSCFASVNPVFAASVERDSRSILSGESISALRDAGGRDNITGLALWLRFARSVALGMWRTNTIGVPIVPVTARRLLLPESKPVYNLTVEDDHVYYANGVLVSNCAIAVEGARRRGFSVVRLEAPQVVDDNNNWRRDLRERAERLRRRTTLTTA